jgi:hypothetical protein
VRALQLEEPLVGAAQRARLEQLERFVPRGIRSLGVECRLTAAEPVVDLGVSVSPDAEGLGPEAFADATPELRLALAEDPRWRRVARFGEHWRDARSLCRAWVPFVFLEYDAGRLGRPVPSVFAALDSPLGDAPSRGFPEREASFEFASILLGNAFDTPRAAALAACFDALDGASRLLHVAVMLGRSRAALRVSAWLSEANLGEYFARLGVPDARDRIDPLLDLLPERREFVQLDFESDPPTACRIGLGHRPSDHGGWAALLDRLVSAGACDAAKAAQLLCIASEGLGDAIASRCELSHVKLVLAASGQIEAKVYLGANADTARPLRPGDPTPVARTGARSTR